MLEKIRKLITPYNILVLGLLIIAFILRVARVDQILAFHYDQGRDALVIWDLINLPHKLFLIGPTTGLAGVFRGPFYYYLIAPFYLLGNGNPVYPSVFLAITSVFALWLMYKIAYEIGGKLTGIFALILGTFSFESIYASRWLSNPTPMLMLSMILIWCLFRIYEGKKNHWVTLSLVLGLSFFHFGSSGELFYFLGVFVFAIWQFFFTKDGIKKIPNIKIIITSIFVFLLTFAPLFIFNLKHGGILANNFGGLFASGKSFAIPDYRFVYDRINLLWGYFMALIFHSPYPKELLHQIVLFIMFIPLIPQLFKNDKLKIVLIMLMSVVIGLIFFNGNFGSVYAYYLTGYYLIFLLVIAEFFKLVFAESKFGKLFVIYFIFFFLTQNMSWIKPYLNTKGNEPDTIVLNNQKQVIDWVYKNAGSRDFNTDTYVPPVISYSYDYLFKWIGTTKYHMLSVDKQVPLLYTLYEADPDHKDRLKAWLDRQKGIGTVVKEETFGGITVQERTRIIKK